MLTKMRGIVIRTVKYSDSSLIFDCLTREAGLESFIVSGIRGKKSRNPAALFQISSSLDMEVYYRQGSSLKRVKEARAARIHESIPYEIHKGAIAQYLVELVRNAIREGGSEEQLFDFIDNCLAFVDQTDIALSLFPAWFAWQLSARMGFGPNMEDWTMDYMDLHSGRFTVEEPHQSEYISPPHSGFVMELMASSMEDLPSLQINRAQRNELLEFAHRYYAFHLDQFRPMKSPEILATVFR